MPHQRSFTLNARRQLLLIEFCMKWQGEKSFNGLKKNKGGHGGICAINTKESHQTVYPQNDKADIGALEKSQWNTDKLL